MTAGSRFGMFFGRPPSSRTSAPMIPAIEPIRSRRLGERLAPRRRAFSLVEMLAVIAIVSTLVGLVLPTVQRVRESARMVTCGTNVRETALGVCSYESARRSFPAGYDATPHDPNLPEGTQHAWSSVILPSIDEQGLASQINYANRWDAPGGAVTAAQIAGEPYISRESGSGTRQFADNYFRQAGVAPEDLNIVMELGSPEAIKGVVETGIGVAIMSSATVAKELKLGSLTAVPLEPRLMRTLSLVYPREKFRSRLLSTFVEFATGKMRTMAKLGGGES